MRNGLSNKSRKGLNKVPEFKLNMRLKETGLKHGKQV